MRMQNAEGRAIYYNTVEKRGKLRYIVKSIDGQPIIGRDKQKRQSRTFTQEPQAEAWIRRNGYRYVFSVEKNKRQQEATRKGGE